jgi:hypothetical protein
MPYTGARVSKMAKHSFWLLTLAESASYLSSHDTCQEDAGYLAMLYLVLSWEICHISRPPWKSCDRSVTRPPESFLEELHTLRPIQKAIAKFVAARQFTDHPVAVTGQKAGSMAGG